MTKEQQAKTIRDLKAFEDLDKTIEEWEECIRRAAKHFAAIRNYEKQFDTTQNDEG